MSKHIAVIVPERGTSPVDVYTNEEGDLQTRFYYIQSGVDLEIELVQLRDSNWSIFIYRDHAANDDLPPDWCVEIEVGYVYPRWLSPDILSATRLLLSIGELIAYGRTVHKHSTRK